MPDLMARALAVAVNDTSIINNVSLAFKKHELVALVGANGAGKSTLLRSLAGLTNPSSGNVLLDGNHLFEMAPYLRARRLTYLPQSRPIEWPITVKELVSMGRFSYGGLLGKLSQRDEEAVAAAMSSCAILDLANRKTNTLSGGELTRTHCARVFAACAEYMLFDEPIAALDPRHQIAIMKMIRQEVNKGSCAIVVMHDLSMAARFADRLIWLKNGSVLADGTVPETMSPDTITQAFEISAEILPDKHNTVILGDITL